MDKAAGILAELLYSDNLVAEIKEYRPIMLHVIVHYYIHACNYYYLPCIINSLVCGGQSQGPEVPSDWV